MSYVTLKDPLRGRLGNQLFQVNFAAQIASKLNVPLRLGKTSVNQLCEKSNYAQGKYAFRSKPNLILNREYFLQSSTEEVIDFCLNAVDSGRNIELPSSMLGEVFFDYLFVDPKSLFTPNRRISLPNDSNFKDYDRIAMHFRGSDFQDWNSNYVMEYEYYCRVSKELNINGTRIDLFTDDPQHSTVIALYRNGIVSRIIHSRNYFEDFWQLSKYPTLVASPSTFPLWSAILGQTKLLIYDKNWYQNYGVKEVFWKQFLTCKNLLMPSINAI